MKLYAQKGFKLVKREKLSKRNCKKWQKMQNFYRWHGKYFEGNKLETQKINIQYVLKGF